MDFDVEELKIIMDWFWRVEELDEKFVASTYPIDHDLAKRILEAIHEETSDVEIEES